MVVYEKFEDTKVVQCNQRPLLEGQTQNGQLKRTKRLWSTKEYTEN